MVYNNDRLKVIMVKLYHINLKIGQMQYLEYVNTKNGIIKISIQNNYRCIAFGMILI